MKKALVLLAFFAVALAQVDFTAEEFAQGLFGDTPMPPCEIVDPTAFPPELEMFCFETELTHLEVMNAVMERYLPLGLTPHPVAWRSLDGKNGMGWFVLGSGKQVMVVYTDNVVSVLVAPPEFKF